MNLEQIRKNKGLSQCELADRLQVSKSYISHLECGRRQMGLDLLRKYASIVSMKPEEILKALESTQQAAVGERNLALQVSRIVIKEMKKNGLGKRVLGNGNKRSR